MADGVVGVTRILELDESEARRVTRNPHFPERKEGRRGGSREGTKEGGREGRKEGGEGRRREEGEGRKE